MKNRSILYALSAMTYLASVRGTDSTPCQETIVMHLGIPRNAANKLRVFFNGAEIGTSHHNVNGKWTSSIVPAYRKRLGFGTHGNLTVTHNRMSPVASGNYRCMINQNKGTYTVIDWKITFIDTQNHRKAYQIRLQNRTTFPLKDFQNPAKGDFMKEFLCGQRTTACFISAETFKCQQRAIPSNEIMSTKDKIILEVCYGIFGIGILCATVWCCYIRRYRIRYCFRSRLNRIKYACTCQCKCKSREPEPEPDPKSVEMEVYKDLIHDTVLVKELERWK